MLLHSWSRICQATPDHQCGVRPPPAAEAAAKTPAGAKCITLGEYVDGVALAPRQRRSVLPTDAKQRACTDEAAKSAALPRRSSQVPAQRGESARVALNDNTSILAHRTERSTAYLWEFVQQEVFASDDLDVLQLGCGLGRQRITAHKHQCGRAQTSEGRRGVLLEVVPTEVDVEDVGQTRHGLRQL